jgi:intracellular septation protein
LRLLRRGWMIRYITPIARNVSEATMVAVGYAWAVLMATLATWAGFVLVGAVGAKVSAVALQYAVFRTIVRRRLAQPVA